MIKLIKKNETVLCIDPGSKNSGIVLFNGKDILYSNPEMKNEDVLIYMNNSAFQIIAIEMVACYGMSVGRSVFDTCVWIGRFQQNSTIICLGRIKFYPIFRRDVKLFLCNSLRAKEKNIKQAIRDFFPSTGGGATHEVGTKKQPGPLFGIKSHSWDALALGLTYFYDPKSI